jgi:hypothetical protein
MAGSGTSTTVKQQLIQPKHCPVEKRGRESPTEEAKRFHHHRQRFGRCLVRRGQRERREAAKRKLIRRRRILPKRLRAMIQPRQGVINRSPPRGRVDVRKRRTRHARRYARSIDIDPDDRLSHRRAKHRVTFYRRRFQRRVTSRKVPRFSQRQPSPLLGVFCIRESNGSLIAPSKVTCATAGTASVTIRIIVAAAKKILNLPATNSYTLRMRSRIGRGSLYQQLSHHLHPFCTPSFQWHLLVEIRRRRRAVPVPVSELFWRFAL